ncbi:rCG33657, partial [Rattus norvegicus]
MLGEQEVNVECLLQLLSLWERILSLNLEPARLADLCTSTTPSSPAPGIQ